MVKDDSISRKHSVFTTIAPTEAASDRGNNKWSNGSVAPELQVEDFSKYGMLINGTKLTEKTKYTLSERLSSSSDGACNIQFGVKESKFIVKSYHLIGTYASMNPRMQSLQSDCDAQDICLMKQSDFLLLKNSNKPQQHGQPCQVIYFVHDTSNIHENWTIELLNAIMHSHSVVTVEYLRNLIQFLNERGNIGSTANEALSLFVSILDAKNNKHNQNDDQTEGHKDPLLAWNSNGDRKLLFDDKNVLFLKYNDAGSSTDDDLSQLIRMGSGTCQTYDLRALVDSFSGLDEIDEAFLTQLQKLVDSCSTSVLVMNDRTRSAMNSNESLKKLLSLMQRELKFTIVEPSLLAQCIIDNSVQKLPLMNPSKIRTAFNMYKQAQTERIMEKQRREQEQFQERQRLEEEERRKQQQQQHEAEKKREEAEKLKQQKMRTVVKSEPMEDVGYHDDAKRTNIKEEPRANEDDDETADELDVIVEKAPETKIVSRKDRKRRRGANSQLSQATQQHKESEEYETEPIVKRQKIDPSEFHSQNARSTDSVEQNYECFISVEYVDLIPSFVKKEQSLKKEESFTVYNAKKFRKAKFGQESKNSQTSQHSSISTPNDSIDPVSIISTSCDNVDDIRLSRIDSSKVVVDKRASVSQNSTSQPSGSPAKSTSQPALQLEDDTEQDEEYQNRIQKVFEQNDDNEEESDDEEALDLLNANVKPKRK